MFKQQRIGIRFKIIIGYIVIICCLIVAGIVINERVTGLQQERNSLITYDTNMRVMSNNLERQILGMESALHRYMITEDEAFLEPYYQGLATWESKYHELENIAGNYSEGRHNLPVIYDSIDSWITQVGAPLIELLEAEATEQMIAIFNSKQSSVAMTDLQAQFTAFRTGENQAIQEQLQALDNVNKELTIALFLGIAFIALIAITIASTISRRIVGSITEVTETTSEIIHSSGDLSKRIKAGTNDEVRDLVETTNALLESLEKREWLQKNLAEVVTSYQGISSMEELGKVLLSSLVARTDSAYGAFYIQNQEDKAQFNKVAVYAEKSEDTSLLSFRKGEGLIGQCVLEKRTLKYENIQFLETSIGNVPLKNGVLIPVLFEHETIAVLEIATFNDFTPHEEVLIEEVVDNLGLTIDNILGRMEIIRLLNESQVMTEELQVQAEELQTQSEELQMQTEELTTINEKLEERTRYAEQKSIELQKTQKELEQSAEELLQSSNYKSEFLANMSHELRTPLNSILILSEMLAENGEKRLTEDEVEYANVIHTSGKDLLALINDILDLSKVEAGKMEVWFNEMDIYELPQYVERMFMPVAQQKGLDLNIQVSEQLDAVFYTDIKRLQQILNNLLSNAMKFTEHGQVQVIIDPANVTSKMKNYSDTWLAISVKDTGIGIPKEKQDLIFETFQQADGATVRKYGGTGLGLSICREFSKILGGWITVESIEGEGSSFTLYLPSLPNGVLKGMTQLPAPNQQAETAGQIEQTNMSHMFNNKHVLVVDDDHRNIYALKQALGQKGAITIEASNGLQCLEILQSQQPVDVVLMDIMMPEMDGYETMEHIRKDLKLVDLPIIALTAKAMKQDRDRAIAVGASDYISKPLNLDQLFSVLSVWLTDKEHSRNG